MEDIYRGRIQGYRGYWDLRKTRAPGDLDEMLKYRYTLYSYTSGETKHFHENFTDLIFVDRVAGYICFDDDETFALIFCMMMLT
jgi:hypothetical protein